jgi:hypothetical protein
MADFLDKMRDLLKPYRRGTAPLEIRRAILDEVQSRIVTAGVGKRIFPYNRIRIHILADTPQERDELETIVHEAWDLKADVAERLRDHEAKAPADLTVEIAEIVVIAAGDEPDPAFGDRRFRLELQKAESVQAAPLARPILDLTVLKGTASQHVYTFEGQDRINLGRLEEVFDAEERVRRRNDVIFLEEGDISATVSREQARLAWDDEIKAYRLRAEPGASVTRILRDGRTIDVSPQDRRGIKVQPGDEIYLGRACIKVGLRTAEAADA